jgi:hypothetical protein
MRTQYLKEVVSALTDTATAEVWILAGSESSTKHSFRVLFAGTAVQKNFIVKVAFDGACEEQHVGKVNAWQLYRLIHENGHDCSLAVVEGDFFHRYIYLHGMGFYVPIWIKSTAKIPFTCHESDMRKIKKNKLDHTITTAQDQLDDFYHHMYLPTVTTRHQDRTIAMEYPHMMQKVQEGSCELLLVRKDGVPIGGGLIRTDEAMPRLWSGGTKNGDPIHLKEGAMLAVDYFSSVYLAEKGYQEVDLGLSRSFLSDGVLQYKRRWNIRVAPYNSKGFVVKPLCKSPGLTGFFTHNPFVCLGHGRLAEVVFVDGEGQCSGENLERLRSAYAMSGISEFKVFQINDTAADHFRRIPNN